MNLFTATHSLRRSLPAYPVVALLVLAMIGAASNLRGQAWELFESSSVPAVWSVSGTGASIRTDNSRSWQGNRSLEWSWSQPSTTLTWTIAPATSGSGHRVLSQWVRLETPLPDARLRVELRSTNNSLRYFEVNLDFTGWRTMFVPYSSMDGSGTNNINRVRWTLVGSPPQSGKIHLDQVIAGQLMDVRFQYADAQVPFVWAERVNSMWENKPHWHRARPARVVPTAAELAALAKIRVDWDSRLAGTGTVTTSQVNSWETQLNAYNLRREGGVVRGNPIYYRQYPEYAYPSTLANQIVGAQAPNAFQDFTTLMYNMARAWHRTTNTTLRSRLADMIVLMSEHLLDQGWAGGSNQGSIFLYGYQSREYMRAMYLARHIYAQTGMLDEMLEAALWYGQAGFLLDGPRAPNMDFFNTLLQGQMLSLLMDPDPGMQTAWMRLFIENLSDQVANHTPGDLNGFKPDGTTYHHNGHYPAYGIGAISTLGGVFDVLRGTPFELTDPARMSFRQVLLAARHYAHPYDWPIGLSGRHPFSGTIGNARSPILALSLYPDPVLGNAPDRELAGAYVRLWGQPDGTAGTAYQSAGIQAETGHGFHPFPFANHAVYRFDDWMVSLKGYSRYVWASEIYAADNRYGRYQSNGTAEILFGSGRTASGFRENGWDWNRLPGTTTVHLPIELLDSPHSGTLMRRSNETFAGGVSGESGGAFGFVLNEAYYGHLLTARKSAFAADGMLIMLGSGISSNHSSAPVETTLYQVALTGGRPPIYLSTSPDTPVSNFPWTYSTTPSTAFWTVDPVGNAFWMPPGQHVRFSRVNQESRHNKTSAVTNGDFASAWIDHGTKPDNARYEYVILPQRSVAQVAQFTAEMASASPAYEVLRHDNGLHAVRVANPNRYGFAIYEPNEWSDLPHLTEAETPFLLWIEEAGNHLVVFAANPDLNSTPEENLVSPTSFTLRGLWEVADTSSTGILAWHDAGDTRFVIPARNGATYRLHLMPAASPIPGSLVDIRDEIAPPANFSAAAASPFIHWNVSSGAILGYVVERRRPGATEFEFLSIVSNDATHFFDPELAAGDFAHYRVRCWTEAGPGAATTSILVHNARNNGTFFDFRTISAVNDLQALGWTASGLQSANDWYLEPRGMFLIDNSTNNAASLVVPFAHRATGRIEARMGVARTSGFYANLELMAGSESLGLIQLSNRENGFLRGPSDVSFSDVRWDIEQGTLRDLAIEWRELPGTGQIAIVLRYTGTTDAASALHYWQIPNTVANRPDRLRLSVGFGSAVNRGMVLQTLEIAEDQPAAPAELYAAWTKAFLGEYNADPAADADGDGVPNLWEFAWSRGAAAEHVPARSDLIPQMETGEDGPRFVWEIPILTDSDLRLETTDRFDSEWTVVSHIETPIIGRPGWTRITSPPVSAADSSRFFRLVLVSELNP